MAYVTGFDVSHWQTPSDALADRREGAGDKFCWIKASQGATGHDPATGDHHTHLARFARGPYHFYKSSADAIGQARNFVETTDPLDWELPHVLDYENESGDADPADLLAFLTYVETHTHRTPVIYTGPAWWKDTIGNRPEFARFPLWLAAYPGTYDDGVSVPKVMHGAPAPWPRVDVWQFSSAHSLDRNVCTVATLAALTHPTQEDDMTPAQEAKIDALAAKLDEALPILRKLKADYLTPGKSVRQVILHDEKLDEEQAHHDRAADIALGKG